MDAKDLKKFEKKIVKVEFSEYTYWSQYCTGIIIFCKKGIIVYNGKEENAFSGMGQSYEFDEKVLLKDYIPYVNIVSVFELTDVKSLGNLRLTNISNMLQNKRFFNMFSPFQLEYSEQIFVEDPHRGMIYNPYSDRWSFL